MSMIRKFTRNERLMAYFQILMGSIIGGMAYPLFMTPSAIAPGGVTGVTVILNHIFGLPVGVTSLILNIPIFALAYRSMGRIFAFRSVIAMILFSLAIDVLPLQAMTMDPLLATLFGGVLLGIGLGLIMRGGATTGGTDMLANIIHRRVPFLQVGMILFSLDFLVIMAAGVFIGANEALYALINIYVSSKVIDAVLMGFTANKACYVITSKWEKVTDRILKELERGATLFQARGAWTHDERPVIMCVISRSELSRLKRVVREEDAGAFVIVTEAFEALGEGFESLQRED